jgi:hypothetical protein
MGLLENASADIQQGEITLDLILTAAILGGLIFVGYEIYQAAQGASTWLCTHFPTFCPSDQNNGGGGSDTTDSSQGVLCEWFGIGCGNTSATDPSLQTNPIVADPSNASGDAPAESPFDGSGVTDDISNSLSGSTGSF